MALPAILVFRVFYALSMAIGAAKLIAAINVVLVLVKIPMNALLMDGVPGLLEPLGAAGCGLSLAVVSWVAAFLGLWSLKRHRAFQLLRLRFERPKQAEIRAILQMGYPISLMQVAEVASFAAMGICVARLEPAQIAAHQAAANIATTLFMLPLALSLASSVLVSRALGARDTEAEQRASRVGLRMSVVVAGVLAALIGASSGFLPRLYTHDAQVAAYLRILLVWVAASQLADCVQVYLICLLRSYGLTLAPSIINIATRAGVGFVGGYLLAFGPLKLGTTGFWIGSFCGLCVSAVALWSYTRRSVWAPTEVRGLSRR